MTLGVTLGFPTLNPSTFAFFVGIGDDGGIFAYAHHPILA